MFRRRPYGRRGGANYGLIMILMRVAQIGVHNIPPVTLASVAGMVVIYYDFLKMHLPPVSQVCMVIPAIIGGGQLYRIATAAVFHASDMHLGYNMSSMLWKGRLLEPVIGSARFAALITFFALASNALVVGVGYGLFHLIEYKGVMRQCILGWSAVLFALKVVATHYSPNSMTRVMFFTFPTKYAYWAELVLISVVTPNASFLGHLCGILIGLAYVRGYFAAIPLIGTPPRLQPGAWNDGGWNVGGAQERHAPREQPQARAPVNAAGATYTYASGTAGNAGGNQGGAAVPNEPPPPYAPPAAAPASAGVSSDADLRARMLRAAEARQRNNGRRR